MWLFGKRTSKSICKGSEAEACLAGLKQQGGQQHLHVVSQQHVVEDEIKEIGQVVQVSMSPNL